VTDHCQSSGGIWLNVFNNVVNGPVGQCWFQIFLSNNAPEVKPETVFALANHSLVFSVRGDDPDCDSVELVEFDEMWFQLDSLQPPTIAPSCEDGCPALFSWSPAKADTGLWLCSFSATDACGGVGSDQVSILVGLSFCGDSNPDEVIDLGDLVFLLNYLFKGGPPPDPLCKGNANCDEAVDLGDLVRLLNYLFKHGSAPCFDCCPR
jgi:hypothetical protein